MKHHYNVEVLELKEVHEMPWAWDKNDFQNLLELIEYEDVLSIPDEDLKEMAAMAISDLEPEEAAKKVLELRFGEKLNQGQRENLAQELKDDRLWEEYAEISFHEELFNAGCMLNWAFPKIFPTPDMVKLTLRITALNDESKENLENPLPAFIARLITHGMDEHNAIFRLFNDKINANSFPEAEDIIWMIQDIRHTKGENNSQFTIYTSWNWLDEIKGVQEFESHAYADGQAD